MNDPMRMVSCPRCSETGVIIGISDCCGAPVHVLDDPENLGQEVCADCGMICRDQICPTCNGNGEVADTIATSIHQEMAINDKEYGDPES